MVVVLVSAALVIFIAYFLIPFNTEPDLPRVGQRGLIGYILTALHFIRDAESVVQEGWVKFSGQPFVVPTLSKPLVILGPQYVDIMRKSDDTVFNQPIALGELLQMDYTMNAQVWRNPYHTSIIGTDVPRAIPTFIPEILEETELAMQDTFDPSMDSGPTSLPVFDTLACMIGRITTRAILGTELCRNEKFVREILTFAKTLFPYARVLVFFPHFMRPTIYSILSSIFGGQKQPKKTIIPFLEQQSRKTDDKPNNIAELIIRKSGEETAEQLAVRVLHVNFASIHTSTIFLTLSLFELAVLPKSDIQSIRSEVTAALETEGGWNKNALAKFRKIDSLLKEVGRFYGLSISVIDRLVIRDEVLRDGTRIPAGSRALIYSKAAHFNPDIYPNPDTFDAFRFSRLREVDDSNVKHGFTTINNNYLAFGTGRHACPGRFFVAMELKIMIAHLLLNYDISLPMGTEKPKIISFQGTTVPDSMAKLVFKRRVNLVQ